MSIDFTPGIINTYHGDIYNCTTNTDNVKTPDTPKCPCDNWEEQQPINSTFSGEGYNPEQFDLAQQQLQQINACHTNTTYTNADYSKVVVQLVSLINNIETISSTPLTQQTQHFVTILGTIQGEQPGFINKVPYNFLEVNMQGIQVWHLREVVNTTYNLWDYGYGAFWPEPGWGAPYYTNAVSQVTPELVK